MPAVLDGMDKAEALAYVSRLFDAAQAGAAVWGDALLIKRFITQCSRTDSEATRAAYRFEIKEFCRWRQRNHPHLHLREINPAFCQDWVDELRREVEAERMKPRTFNRRIAAISSLYRWAAEPCRSPVTGVPRNPMPPRSMLMAAIARAVHLDRNAKRDYALVRAPACWVAGSLRSQLSGGRTSKFSPMAVKFTSLEKDPKQGLFECPVTRSSFFTRLAAAKLTAMYFRVPAARDISLDKRLEMFAGSGAEPQGFTFTHTN